MIKITSDSTCDLSKELLDKNNISTVPLHILIDEVDYKDGVDINANDVFRFVGEEGKSCKTAAVNVFEYETFFEPFTKEFDAVIHINLGSGFSSCYQNARIAAASFDNVYVIDSENLSAGSGILVLEAVRLAEQGVSAEQIVETIEQLKKNVDCSFVIDKLDYLRKGGRCSSVEALGATLLKIKPSIEVIEGVMKVGKKYRGKFERCVDGYIQDRLTLTPNIDYSKVCLVSTEVSDEEIATITAQLKQANFEEVYVSTAGCTISSHCGPHTLGIIYLKQ